MDEPHAGMCLSDYLDIRGYVPRDGGHEMENVRVVVGRCQMTIEVFEGTPSTKPRVFTVSTEGMCDKDFASLIPVVERIATYHAVWLTNYFRKRGD